MFEVKILRDLAFTLIDLSGPKVAVIKKVPGGFELWSKDKKKLLGKHKTKEDARKQEIAIMLNS